MPVYGFIPKFLTVEPDSISGKSSSFFLDSEIFFFHKDYNKNLYYIYNIDYVYGGKNPKKIVIENIDELGFVYLRSLILEIETNNEE